MHMCNLVVSGAYLETIYAIPLNSEVLTVPYAVYLKSDNSLYKLSAFVFSSKIKCDRNSYQQLLLHK